VITTAAPWAMMSASFWHDEDKNVNLTWNVLLRTLICRVLATLCVLTPILGFSQSTARAAARPPVQKVIVDTDIGDDIDDAYALALVASSPNVDLLGVTTTWGETGKRAQIAAKLLAALGRGEVPVCAGRAGTAKIGRQYDWARDFHSKSIQSVDAVTFLHTEIDRAPGQITLIGIGPEVNLGDLLTRFPEDRRKIKNIVLMGGSVFAGYSGHPPSDLEWNIRCDAVAARAVFSSGVPLTIAPLGVTTMMQLDAERQKKLFADGSPGSDALAALTNIWGGGTPTLYDVVAASYALGHSFSDAQQCHIDVIGDGMTQITPGSPNVTVLIHPQPDKFLDWFVETLHTQLVAHG
jgi:purine nucleosidase